MVYYRKYRPQKIEELDSSEVREKLYGVLKSSSVPHAFLFTGPKGLGKTSTARIVAKVLNCERKHLTVNNLQLTRKVTRKGKKSNVKSQMLTVSEDIEPCNKCYQCISITNGTNLDVLEIDGASNRGIDEIRDLREKVKLSPASSNKKVYIIDEVHMLTTEAFNALLKTLEEPPNHVVFILCTTEPHKVPSTIASRCFHIQFNKAKIDELISSFERIIKSEKLQAELGALSQIANMSDGSFRDGSKILEELVLATGGSKLTKDLVEKKYQVSNINLHLQKMIEYLASKDVKKGLDHVSKLTAQGMDMGYFIQQLIEVLHKHFLYKAGVKNSSGFRVPASKFGEQSSELGIEETKRLIELLSKAHGEIKYAVLPQLPLEMAILEWSLGGALRSPRQFSRSAGSAKAPRATISNNLLQDLINKVKVHNHSIAGVLRGCRVISYDNKHIIIETGYKFHKERLDEKKAIEIIEKAYEEIAGVKAEISVRLK